MPLPELELRPVGPDDRERVASMFERLSFESRLMRFNTPKPRLTPRELSFLTDIDQFRHVAVAAVDRRDGSIVGTARYVQQTGRPGVADVAVEVVDELQNRGIGTALAAAVIERARENGFRLLTATTLWENRAARALLRRLQFNTRARQRGELELELSLEG
ncbi:MAG: GNAT family N-acetyltransferase [Solirubrobacteraceae bacterium]